MLHALNLIFAFLYFNNLTLPIKVAANNETFFFTGFPSIQGECEDNINIISNLKYILLNCPIFQPSSYEANGLFLTYNRNILKIMMISLCHSVFFTSYSSYSIYAKLVAIYFGEFLQILGNTFCKYFCFILLTFTRLISITFSQFLLLYSKIKCR